ncbi:methylated-DNA--[protein]-cysteine S-methyltransferase [Dactylosporangium sp. NPDC050588]|uniref:methylated-DNA--[protein]-cysteine S-methyltransferase n=1 Tax=Dactylosporangium sp. NPDC050588 TaxID=3157211 RepID=UPI0033DDE78F
MLYSVSATPAGPLTIVVDDDGAVLASGFTASLGELSLFVDVGSLRQVGDVGDAQKAAQSYLDGDVHAIDDVVVRQRPGGEFLTHAWDVLRTVPAGAPVTYSEFAALSGRPPAIRAAAQACARNAAALFVPCHRVLRTDGTLGGFRWGLPVKRWLLDHEASVA